MRRRRHLVLFAREPRLGRVKGRLAADIGALEALRFYEAMLHRTLRRLSVGPWTTRLCVTPDRFAWTARRALRLPSDVHVAGQGGGDLGVRMRRALVACPPGPAVLVGTDIPGLEPAHVEAAFAVLGRHDAVFGPAEDGGFWLVGLRRSPRVPPGLFAGVRWSTGHALADAVAGIAGHGSVGFAETLADVDDGHGYRRAAAVRERPWSGYRSSATRRR